MSRRYQYGTAAGAVILAAAAIGCIWHRLYLQAGLFTLTALVLTEAATRERRRRRRDDAEETWQRRVATPYCPHPGPLTPCCPLGQHSQGAAHRYCTRPSEGRSRDAAFMGRQRAHHEQLLAALPEPGADGWQYGGMETDRD